MSTEVSIYGRVRKLLEGFSFSAPDLEQQPTLNNQLELLVSIASSPYMEITRSGRSIKVGTATAVAGVVAIPTTAVGFAIYNAEPDGGKSFVLDEMSAINAVSTAVATQAQMLAMIGQVREATPTDAALAIVKKNGMGGGADANIRTILTATALPATTGIAANWFPVGMPGIKTGVAATPGYGMYQRIDGAIICPPGRYLAMHVLASVVGETFQMFMHGHMKQIENG